MTAKNRNKSNSSEKSAASSQDDAPKKIQKSTSTNGQVVEEMHQTSARHEESARQNAALGSKMESVVQQVGSLKSVVDGLESSLGITRVELEGAVSRMKRGEVETRRVEEALQKLQNDLLRDLSEGIKEVKEAREWDFSSLEKTVEDRLAEVSQSVKASVTEFTEAQGEAQRELADLKARLGGIEDPALIKQELSAIVDVVAEIRTTKQDSDASSESLREQIFAVRSELQTRNREVASLSEEIETVRSVMQDTVESLRQSLSATKADIQALKDKDMTLESSVEQAADAVRSVEKAANEAADQVRRQSEDLEERVKASEVSGDSLMVSVTDITSKVESLLTKYDTHESTLAEHKQAVEKVKSGLQEMEAVKSSLGELQSNIVALGDAQNELTTKDSDLDQQVKELEERFAALEGKSNVEPEQLQSLRGMVDGLEAKAAKLEGHDQAISALQEALQETTRTLAGLAKVDDQVEVEEEHTEEEVKQMEEEEKHTEVQKFAYLLST
ncbi:Cytoskeleton-associated protein 4 63-kDa cytoskeleton-linking membrane protein [Collichthys lucidus]|uniref:Cytoskeleton-associated protein 4 63-kDa cytoskeleton-linking membrane protein n=1 Tax=Collichthys lucidus TaxID=240159 RepID=A0A4U5VTW5_COLLU|nr:Cytoskeleton-associated protein 4 63-kDa cytoskeleton-linking membrane protein [Collichthys lucidus]